MAPPSPTARPDLPTGTVTFLFTDIEGSTRLSQVLGDGFASVIDRHHTILRDAFAECGGVVVSTEGDAFFAVFIDAAQAVIGSVTAQRRLAAESWPDGVRIRVRMGMHTGAGRLGGDNYAGADVNRASRVSGAAHGGQVLLTGTTASLVESRLPPGVELRGLGDVLLKDIDGPQTVVQLDIDGLPSEFPALRADRPGWLPEPATTFLGRGPEITAVQGHLRDSRLVTLTGPGGTGKTRLSIEVARAALPGYPGGAWFVPLEAIRTPALVLPEVAERLDVEIDAQSSAAEAIAGRVGEKPTLLVLDNLEQVVGVAPELGQLLGSTPGLRILASSREALRIEAEQEFPVPVMDQELAELLFTERARKVKPGFSIDEESREEIRRIVARLDCLPLAIELAAARVRLFPPRKLRERLEEHIETLSDGSRDLPDRQRTLRGAVEWSHDLLDADEQLVFARFSTFAGGADFEAAAAIIDPGSSLDSDVLDVLASLADKSLLRIEDGFGGEPRAAMLETIREYAAERLAQHDDAGDVAARHAQHYLAFTERIEPELIGEHPVEAFAQMEMEHDNIRSALEWSVASDPAVGLRIGGAIWRFWQQRGHMDEGRVRLRALLDAADPETDPCAVGKGATGFGGLAYWQADIETARTEYTRALEAFRACGDEPAIALGLYNLSFPAAFQKDIETASQLQAEALEHYEALGDEDGIVSVKESQVIAAIMTDDFERAREIQTDVVAIRRGQEGLFKRGDSVGLLAMVEAVLGHAEAARALADEAWQCYQELQDESGYLGGLQIEALVTSAEDRPEATAFLLGAEQGLRDEGVKALNPLETLGVPHPGLDAREKLGADFDDYYEAGRRATPQEAFERVRGTKADLRRI